MSEVNDFLKENPHIKLNEEVTEYIPVQRNSVDIDSKGNPKVVTKTVMERQTVKYIHAPKVKSRCAVGEHVFKVIDTHKYLFACTLCPFVRQVYPSTYSFNEETGKLTHRVTNQDV